MNREIKFRGLREDGKGLVYGDLSFNRDRSKAYISVWEERKGEDGMCWSHIVYEVVPKSIGQFIASNGKQDFYVGDIVVNPRGRKHTVVIWDNLPCLQYTDKSKVYFAPMTNGFLNNKTVIGNIHEKGGSR